MARNQGPGLLSQAPKPRVNAAERRAINRGEMQAPQAPRVNAAERRAINQGQMQQPQQQQSRPQPAPMPQQPQQTPPPMSRPSYAQPPMQGQPGQGFKSPIAPSQANEWMNPGIQYNGGSQQQPYNPYGNFQGLGSGGMPQFQQYQQAPYIGNQPMPQGSGLSWNWQQRKY